MLSTESRFLTRLRATCQWLLCPVMTPKKALNISSSSLFGLKAELSKRQDELTRNKALGKGSAIVGGVKRPDKVRCILDLIETFISRAHPSE